MVSQDKLIKEGIQYTDKLFDEIIKRLEKGVLDSDTLEEFLRKTKEYTTNNPLVSTDYDKTMLNLILAETNNHKFSRPAQKELVRVTIENQVGDLIRDVGEDIKQSVRDIVTEEYNNPEGSNPQKMAKQISKKVSGIKNKRAKTIARTEIARTATISDYIIANERGATHYTVNCRSTRCPICKKMYCKSSETGGDVEYEITDTSNLPPVHPNCRCSANFYSKGGSKTKTKTETGNAEPTKEQLKGNQEGQSPIPQQVKGGTDYEMKPITPKALDSFEVKDIGFGKRSGPLIITRELVKKYSREFLTHRWYHFEEYASKVTSHYESYYTENFLNKLKTPISSNTLEGTKSIYDSFKYGCGKNFGRLNAYYRDKMGYVEQLRQLGETEENIKEICERHDKIRVNILEGMKKGIPLTEDTALYRATSTNHKIPLTEGEIGTFEGFTSTSFETETPTLFYEKDSKKYNVFYKILAPKGTRGMALGSADKLTNTSGQNEWLLPETQYKVKHVNQEGNNYYVVVELTDQII